MAISHIPVQGGVTAASGFRAAGVACGIKAAGRDLMLLAADRPCAAAGVFTRNQVKAAPVLHDQEVIRGGVAQAVVINSGVANACTGDEGMMRCRAMATEVAVALGIPEAHVLVCSTGVIGRQLPGEKIAAGIAMAAGALASDGGHDAARAIMTTDTHPKEVAVRVEMPGRAFTVGGMAKGSGMIAPNMATMLSVITTDARVDAATLQTALSDVTDRTFNCVTVDGDTSTNDTLLLLASGASGVEIEPGTELHAAFVTALYEVASQLARMIARDGEGATKLVTVNVRGAVDRPSAAKIAHTIADSPLVKTALFGNDPNWGRVLMAAGRAGVPFDATRVSLDFVGIPVVRAGQPVPFDLQATVAAMKAEEVAIDLTLAEGDAEATVWTCDFSYDYVKINAEYTT